MNTTTGSIPSASATQVSDTHNLQKTILQSLSDISVRDLVKVPIAFFNSYGTGDASTGISLVTISAGIATVAITAIGISSIYKMTYWKRRLVQKDSGKSAPGPNPIPFLGNTLALKSNYYKTLYQYVDKPISIFWVLSTPFVVVNEKESLRRVLGGAGGLYAKPKYFGYRSKAVKQAVQKENQSVIHESIAYNPNGDASRKALEQLVKESLGKIKLATENLMIELADACADHKKKNDRTEAIRSVRKAIVGLNLSVLFGCSEEPEKRENSGRIADMIEFAGYEFAQRMVNPLKVLVDIPGNLKYLRDVGGLIGLGRRLCSVLDETMTNFLNTDPNSRQTESILSDSPNWVHAWIGKVGKIGKLGKVVGLLMASTQTVPLAAVWMLHLVGNDPRVLANLREEFNKVGLETISDLDYEHLEQMKYAEAVIKETLRMYPPFPLIQREAQSDNTLGGIQIPAGTPVYVVPWLVHRNEKYWRDAHSFQPERFLEGHALNKEYESDWVYLPFGRGSRMCAGSKLALTELKVLLFHAVNSFEWNSIDNSLKKGRDERFPELGMIPIGIEFVLSHRKKE